jgi:demethylmenaquinone methyltransferase/2-methoxy-6-polyprenyl-1,4-benzoquinol methylase
MSTHAHGHGHQHGHGHPSPEPYPIALEKMNRFQEREGRAAVADLRLPSGSRGLDVGCGVGLYALWLAETVGPTGSVVAIEPAAERVDAARRYIGSAMTPSRLEFRVGDGTKLDAPDASFDWLWCGDVLHHIDERAMALREFLRVVRPGGTIVVKESQAMAAVFLPGYPALERKLQTAEMDFHREEAGGGSFQERRQQTPAAMREAGLRDVTMRIYPVPRVAPLDESARTYIQHVVFDRNWGDRIRNLVDTETWRQRSLLCDADSPLAIVKRPDYYCMYSFTVWAAARPA